MSHERSPLLLFVAPYFPPACYGGVVQVYLGLLQRLKGYRIVVVSTGPDADEGVQAWDEAAPRCYGFEMRRMSGFEFHLSPSESRLLALPKFFRRVRKEWLELLAELQPDLIVCGGTYSAGWLMEVVRPGPVKINYIHGEELTMQLRPRVLAMWMRSQQRHCLCHADLNIAVSSYTAGLVRRTRGVQPESTRILPNFVDLARFQRTGTRGQFRAAHRWTGPVFLTLARLEPRKGIAATLAAFARLEAEKSLPAGWTYIIAGQGSERLRLEKIVEDLGLGEHVNFLGFVPDAEVPQLYESADIFVQVNVEVNGDTEGFGIVFLEAGACGLPVIGGVAGGTADAIEEGVSGFRVDGSDVEQIAAALQKLACNEALRTEMGLNAKMRVQRGFGVELAAERFAALLQTACAEPRCGPKLEGAASGSNYLLE